MGVHLMGRRLYETMLYWEHPEEKPGDGEIATGGADLAAQQAGRQANLELLEDRRLASGVVDLRYRVMRS